MSLPVTPKQVSSSTIARKGLDPLPILTDNIDTTACRGLTGEHYTAIGRHSAGRLVIAAIGEHGIVRPVLANDK